MSPSPALPPSERFSLLFKGGDDVRQDQLVLQLLAVMDTELKRDGMDLELTTYQALAVGPGAGFVEIVAPNCPLEDVKAKHRNLPNYFASHHPDSSEPLGFSRAVLDRFIRSSAGYCVVTFLLGIGDRHLENILVKPDGRLFHIDFGFILGRDPKPFAPPMKLSAAMVEGMGGPFSEGYRRFQQLACEAFMLLRKRAPLIVSLISLMAEAGIETIAEDAKGQPSFQSLRERFMLGRSSDEALKAFQELMQQSLSAVFPIVVDTLHRWVQAMRT
jgi:phosphatidylinositol 3-kinase